MSGRVPVLGVVGARPNFMKMAPVDRLLRNHPRFRFTLVHTGQHYASMSDPFFRELGIPDPDHHLRVGSGNPAAQIGDVITRLVPILDQVKPRLLLVAGDVTSTLAAALAAHKMGIAVGHIEAGLRSFDESMPEEINRRLTDQITDFCFTHSPEADVHLRREGIPPARIHRVGNLMIDTLKRFLPAARRSTILRRLGLKPRGYALLTLHRPSNVDREADLRKFADLLDTIGREVPVVFPIHPRTLASARRFGVWSAPTDGLRLVDPLGYFDFLRLQRDARFVMTDSGGVQEETTVLGVPCLTLRDNTERPATIRQGTNRLAGTDPAAILRHVRRLLGGDVPPKRVPPLWDGRSARRLVKVLEAGLRPGEARPAGA
ncbi:MAG TPA: UDP-N-acetylglucosamine 2-epimerase (non-hydrolyzing) [Planctomycetota bacterium]|nr:UDP-N-acetylglucosamine 2-epimerase (non-hydrolyzing) [Planctomycetota bacterium]